MTTYGQGVNAANSIILSLTIAEGRWCFTQKEICLFTANTSHSSHFEGIVDFACLGSESSKKSTQSTFRLWSLQFKFHMEHDKMYCSKLFLYNKPIMFYLITLLCFMVRLAKLQLVLNILYGFFTFLHTKKYTGNMATL